MDTSTLENLTVSMADRMIYGSSRLGMYSFGGSVDNGPTSRQFYSGGAFLRGWKQYELANHLGNVLTVISDRNKGVSSGGSLTLPNGATIPAVSFYDPDMVAANDYYPFGMLSRTIGTPDKYRFGFNGKETDNEVKGRQNQQDYGMRIYDPRVGRFLSVDPITKEYPELTPYQFASNRPIDGIDQDGLEFTDYLVKFGLWTAGKIDDEAEKIRNKPTKTTSDKILLFSSGLAKSTPFGAAHQLKKSIVQLKQMTPQERAQATEEYKKQGAMVIASFVGDIVQGKAPGTTAAANSIAPTMKKAFVENDYEAGGELLGTFIQFRGAKYFNDAPKKPFGPMAMARGTIDYQKIFFSAHPELKGKVVVHHAIEYQVLKKYPGLFTEAEINEIRYLRGIPKNVNSEIHLSKIRMEWNEFYNTNSNPTKQQIIDFSKEIDKNMVKSFSQPNDIKYYRLRPEVAGQLGDNTIMETNKFPPVVHKLHYVFYGWLGDDILTASPCFIATERLVKKLKKNKLTGIAFEKCEISKSNFFLELHPKKKLPKFLWLKINSSSTTDFYVDEKSYLIVSEKALSVLKEMNIKNCLIEELI